MAKELESVVELTVVAWAENNGWLARKMQYIGRNSCPDRYFFGFGQIVMIEFKRAGEVPTPAQTMEHMRMEDRGLLVHVIDNVEDGVAVLRFAMDNQSSVLGFD